MRASYSIRGPRVPGAWRPELGFRCCYADLKDWARRREDLSDEELDFVGMKPNGHKPAAGWREAAVLVHHYDDRPRLSPEDSAMLQALMSVPRPDQLEFLA